MPARSCCPQEAASSLARRPCDLRCVGVSFWLFSGVDPIEVVRRAGHSVAVLLRVDARVLAQAQERASRQIQAGLREWHGDSPVPWGTLGGHALIRGGIHPRQGEIKGPFRLLFNESVRMRKDPL